MTLNINDEIAFLKDIYEKAQKINHDLDKWIEEFDKMFGKTRVIAQKKHKAPAIKLHDKTDTAEKIIKKQAKYDNEENKL